MLIDELCKRTSYLAMNDVLADTTLHDLQCVDVLKMIANKKALVIYDTGTGKTLLAAAAMKLLIREDPSRMFIMFVKKDQIVQTPKKLKEFAGLSCVVTTADTKKSVNSFLQKDLTGYNVIMLTHNCLNSSAVLEAIYNIRKKITGVIIDEAHEYNNFNGANSSGVLKAMISSFEYVWGLTATPIVSDLMQLARITSLINNEVYPNPKKLYNSLINGSFKLEYDPGFFINRKASDLGRYSSPRGFVISVEPHPYQLNCNTGGVELFQVCKGEGAYNQVNALIELIIQKNKLNERGLVYISQGTVLAWVIENLSKSSVKFTCINGSTSLEERSLIEKDFADGKFDVILTSITTAVDLDCEYVVFYEFTVLVNQMIGRAHRGLKPKNLEVYFIITKDTKEEDYFVNNIYAKCQIIKEILGKENKAVGEIANQLGVADD